MPEIRIPFCVHLSRARELHIVHVIVGKLKVWTYAWPSVFWFKLVLTAWVLELSSPGNLDFMVYVPVES